jgi:chloramphenicol-sensitive protein RarD
MWGMLPIYLRSLEHIPPAQILLHRIIWSFVFLAIILLAKRHISWLATAFTSRKILPRFILSAIIICINWFIYIWAVSVERVVDASLGYFISPLMNVVFGYFLLQERLRFCQLIAVIIASAGVLWIIIQAGEMPWIGLGIAISFSTYGLLRKTAPLNSLDGLSLETLLLTPFALIFMYFLSASNQNIFMQEGIKTQLLLILAGPITALPLLFFAAGARLIPMSLLGILQYIGPTLQMSIGIFLFNESLNIHKLIGFSLIWISISIYSLDGMISSSNRQKNE